MMNDYLEDEFRPAFQTWQADKTPTGNAAFLKAIDPVINQGLQAYGDDSPLLRSRARLLALDAANKYDPKRSRLRSHIVTNMQGLRRISRQQNQIVNAPERIVLENHKLRSATQELADELGREPTDAELSDFMRVSIPRIAKIRKYQPGFSTGQAESPESNFESMASRLPGDTGASDLWLQVVHQDLDPIDQQILEMTLGMNNRRKFSNLEIAKALNRTPAAITQRKEKIQRLLDQEQALSPFIS
jgi:DNA-directed RNA polymerase specialized sigma subunit